MKTLILLAIAGALTSPLSAQDSTRTLVDSATSPATTLYRNPRTALILGSLIPGAGHIYSGEYWRGILDYESTVGMVAGGALMFVWEKCAFQLFSPTRCDSGPQWPHQALGVAGVGLGFWQWISTARDARHAAERANLRHSNKMAKARPIIDAPIGSEGEWRLGVAIPW